MFRQGTGCIVSVPQRSRVSATIAGLAQTRLRCVPEPGAIMHHARTWSRAVGRLYSPGGHGMQKVGVESS